MSKKIIIICLLIIFLVPVMFLGPHEDFTVRRYLFSCVMPLMMVLVFIVNYLWIIPKNMEREDRNHLIMANVGLILCVTLFMVFWHRIEFTSLATDGARKISEFGRGHMMRHRPPRPDDDNDLFYLLAALRASINFVFAFFVAYTVRMNDHIAELRRQQQEAVVARREAELRGLRNQISPHFLLNTLNNIYALAAISAERTQGAVMQLSKMLRHMLYDNQAEMVTLHSEADFIRSYVDLMKLRLASNVKVDTDINIPEESQTKVAPLLFISLVENAFKHGVSSTEPCFISISLQENDGTITCDISNSNYPKKPSDRSGHGVGLMNVQQRLDIIYPDHYEWVKGVEDGNIYHSVLKLRSVK